MRGMADTPRSSFIPKQTPGATPGSVRRRKRRFDVLSFGGAVVLVGSLALAGGTFFYKDYVAKGLEEQKLALAAERERFSESDIASVRELGRRIAAAKYRLDRHLAISKVFDALELTTMQNVRFRTFSLQRRPSEGVTLTASGVAQEFNTVALQEEQFRRDSIFGEAFFQNVTNSIGVFDGDVTIDAPSDGESGVNFTVVTNITPSALRYTASAAPTPQENNAPADDPSEQTQEQEASAAGDTTGSAEAGSSDEASAPEETDTNDAEAPDNEPQS